MASNRPNILIVHCHDLGQYLHCYGVATVQTPNLDEFATQGVRFANSFCTTPSCSPSRAALFTGRYPHSNGVMGLTHAKFAWDLHPEEVHLAQYLRDAGYSTAAVGIIHETASRPERCGYQRYYGGVFAKDMADQTLALLEEYAETPDQPFFLCVGSIEPHRLAEADLEDTPGDCSYPGNHLEPDSELGVEVPGYLQDTEGARKELAGLQGAVKHVDEQFGRIWRKVQELGIEDNTLIIFTTDHGIAMPHSKCSLFEPGVSVALLMRMPTRAGWNGGATHYYLVQNIDVLPTLLEVVGLPVPSNLQGRSFRPLLDGEAYEPRREVFTELTYHDHYDPRRAIRTETHKLIADFSTCRAFMDPSQRWRPLSDPVSPVNQAMSYTDYLEVYDLTRDPWELENVSEKPEYQAIKRKLAARLFAWMKETDDPLLQGAVTNPHHQKTMALLEEASAQS